MLPRCQACVLGPGTSPAPAGNRPTRWTWTPSWPGSGRARLRQPAGVPAAPGGGRVPAVPAAGGGEQRTALLVTIQVGSRPVTVAAGHPVQQAGPQRPPAAGAASAHRVPGGAAAAGGRPEYALDGAAGGLPAGLAGDRTGPHVPEFRPRLSSWPSAPDDRRLARSRSTTASSGPEVGCCPLGETGPAVAVFRRDEDR
jgi:hypothetical protein